MRKLLLLLPLIALLTACQSKKEICALYVSGEISTDEARNKVGLKSGRIDHYCRYLN